MKGQKHIIHTKFDIHVFINIIVEIYNSTSLTRTLVVQHSTPHIYCVDDALLFCIEMFLCCASSNVKIIVLSCYWQETIFWLKYNQKPINLWQITWSHILHWYVLPAFILFGFIGWGTTNGVLLVGVGGLLRLPELLRKLPVLPVLPWRNTPGGSWLVISEFIFPATKKILWK